MQTIIGAMGSGAVTVCAVGDKVLIAGGIGPRAQCVVYSWQIDHVVWMLREAQKRAELAEHCDGV